MEQHTKAPPGKADGIEISPELATAGTKLREAKKGHETLKRALRHAEQELATAKDKHALALDRLKSAEANVAAGRGADSIKHREEFIDTRNNLDFMAARVAGTENVVTAATMTLEAAQLDFDNAWREYAVRVIHQFEAEYKEAVLAFLAVLDRGLGIAAAVDTNDSRRLFYRLGRQQILSVRNDAHEFYRHRDSWKDSAEAVETYLTLSRLRGQLSGAIND